MTATRAPLLGRGAVVTGAGRGIGAAVARALVEAGAAVVVCARTAAEIGRTAADLRAVGGRVWAVPCDVRDEGAVGGMAEVARGHLGTVDILVNNAGTASSALLHKLSLAEWDDTFAVIARGTFLCTRAFLPAMLERGWGRVVNVASVAGLHGGKYIAHYAAAKHAVIGFTRSAAIEFADTGVSINAVCPAYVDTPLTQRTLATVQARTGLDSAAALQAVLAAEDQTRLVTPVEVAAAVVDLCCSGSESNGAVVVLDGKGNA